MRNTLPYFGFILFITISLSVLLCACGGTTSLINHTGISKRIDADIKSYYGCCNLFAYYINFYERKITTEQIVYNYGDKEGFMPTKFVFVYDEQNQLKYCERYIGTLKEDYEMPVSTDEQVLFKALDVSDESKVGKKLYVFSNIKGFRKPMPNELTHPFPLMRKGYKVLIK